MTLFTTPASTTPAIFQAITDNLNKPGLKGLAIMVIGLVAVFAVIELLTAKFYLPGTPVDRHKSIDDDE